MDIESIGPVMVDLAGPQIAPEERQRLKHPMVGGLIIFSRNIKSVAQLMELNQTIRSINPHLILAVDQEGGPVQRITDTVTTLPCLSKLGSYYQTAPQKACTIAYAHGQLMASEMLGLGFDISFAPVLDIDIGISQVIGDRALGNTPDIVTTLGEAYIKGMHHVGMSATGKHFPGHGSVEADSHHALPIDQRPLNEIEQWDLQPFKQLSQLLDGIMPAHVIYPNACPHPAGFSPFWLQKTLRDQLAFKGVIFSDDLSMEGAKTAGSYLERATTAIQAGCDMVLVCNQPDAADQVLDDLYTRRHEPWLKQSIKEAQPRFNKLLQHQQIDWATFQTSEQRKQLQSELMSL